VQRNGYGAVDPKLRGCSTTAETYEFRDYTQDKYQLAWSSDNKHERVCDIMNSQAAWVLDHRGNFMSFATTHTTSTSSHGAWSTNMEERATLSSLRAPMNKDALSNWVSYLHELPRHDNKM
jgi:hypothetical protein